MRPSRQRAALIGACITIGLALAAAMSFVGGGSALGLKAAATTSPVTVSIFPTPASGTVSVGTEITFIASVAGGTGTYTQYLWSFGDTGTTTTTSQIAKHTYSTSGSFNVTVTVLDSAGNPGVGQTTYVVNSGGTSGTYTVTIQATPPNPTPNTAVQFQAFTSGTAPADAVYTWDFGDNTAGSGTSVSHIYSAAGVYTVKLTVTSVTSPASNTSAQTTVTVGTPAAVYTLSINGPTSVTAGQSATYTANVASGAAPANIQYAWSSSDGGTATGPSFTHTFANAGTYSITLTGSAGNSGANTQTATLSVTVTGPTGPTATYQPGWNLVGGPAGTVFSQALNPLYNFPAGATAYVSVPNTQGVAASQGYWAYFTQTTTVSLSGSSSSSASVSAPAGQYVMIGNPSATQTLTIHGADVIYTFNPATNAYVAATTLAPGQGAWVLSNAGGTITAS
jgi:large repetitive protein